MNGNNKLYSLNVKMNFINKLKDVLIVNAF